MQPIDVDGATLYLWCNKDVDEDTETNLQRSVVHTCSLFHCVCCSIFASSIMVTNQTDSIYYYGVVSTSASCYSNVITVTGGSTGVRC